MDESKNVEEDQKISACLSQTHSGMFFQGSSRWENNDSLLQMLALHWEILLEVDSIVNAYNFSSIQPALQRFSKGSSRVYHCVA